MKYVLSNALLDGGFEKQLTPGIYKSLLITLSGVNNDEQTVGHSDFTFCIGYNGQEIMRIPGAFLLEYNKQRYGFPKVTSVEDGAFELTGIIDFEYLGVDNCLHVTPGDNVTFKLEELAGVATKVESGNCYVDAILGKSPQNYLPRLLPADRSPSGASSPRERLPYRNIATIWLNGTYLSNVVLEEDGETKVSSVYSRLISNTSLQYRLESAAASYAEISLAANMAEILNSDVTLETSVTDSDTVKIQVLSFDFNPERRNASVARVGAAFASKVGRVAISSQGAAEVNEIKALAAGKVSFVASNADAALKTL